MRNLKRALSLTLASVMLLGMMVVGTSALSFNDADDISNVTAASVLEELGVMVGDGQGNFMPDKPVTRAQMAIIICRIMYGNRLNVESLASEGRFTDVAPGEYYTGYVNFAAEQGIISGYGDGRFGPDDTVTTAQAALMLCRGLGYYQNGEDKGDWGTVALNAISLGTKLKMFGDLKLGTNDLLTRDNVAEMTFNTMTKAVPVMYNATWNLYYTDSKNVLGGTSFNYLNSWGFQNYDLVYKDGTDEFRRPTTKWGVGSVNTTGSLGGVDAKGDLIDSAVTLKTPIIEVAKDSTWTYTAKVTYKKLATDIGRNTADGYIWKVNGTTVHDTAAKSPVSVDWTDDDEAVGGSGNGVLTVVYLTTDTKGDTTANLVTIPTYIAQVSSVNSSKKELTLKDVNDSAVTNKVSKVVNSSKDLTLTSDDFDNLASFAKDDYVLVTVGNNKTIQTIKKVEPVTGNVSSYVVDKNVTVDGKQYKYTEGYKGPTGDYKLNTDFELYVDDYGYVIFATGVEADDDYIYVTKGAPTSGVNGGYEIKFIDVAGKEEVALVHNDSVTGNGITKSSGDVNGVAAGAWYKFELKSGKYVLTGLTAADDASSLPTSGDLGAKGTVSDPALVKTVVENGKTSVNYGSGTITANANTTFIVKKGDTVTVYNGVSNVPDVKVLAGKSATVAVIADKDNTSYAKYVMIQSDKDSMSTSGSVAGERIFIVDSVRKQTSETSDNKKLYTYEAVRTGVEEEKGIISTSNAWTPGLYKDIAYDGEWVDTMNAVTGISDDALKQYSVSGKDIAVVDDALNVSGIADILAKDCKVFITDGDELTITDAAGLDAKYSRTNLFTGDIYTVIDNKQIIEVYVVENMPDGQSIPSDSSVKEITDALTEAAGAKEDKDKVVHITDPKDLPETVPSGVTLALHGNVPAKTFKSGKVSLEDATVSKATDLSKVETELTGDTTVSGTLTIGKFTGKGTVELDGGEVKLASGATTLPNIDGTGVVNVTAEVTGDINFGGVNKETGKAEAGNTTPVAVPVNKVTMKGDQKVTGFSSELTLDQLAARTGGTTVSPYTLTLNGAVPGTLTAKITVKKGFTPSGESEVAAGGKVDGIFAGGTSLTLTADDIEAGKLEISTTVSDNVSKIVYTIALADGSTKTWTFTFN